MATYPTSIYWDKSSAMVIRAGIAAEEMTSGAIHTQTYYPANQVRFRVRHKDLTAAERDQVVGFLQTNAGKDITLTEPLTQQDYIGRQVSDISVPYSGDTFYSISWEFMGEAV